MEHKILVRRSMGLQKLGQIAAHVSGEGRVVRNAASTEHMSHVQTALTRKPWLAKHTDATAMIGCEAGRAPAPAGVPRKGERVSAEDPTLGRRRFPRLI